MRANEVVVEEEEEEEGQAIAGHFLRTFDARRSAEGVSQAARRTGRAKGGRVPRLRSRRPGGGRIRSTRSPTPKNGRRKAAQRRAPAARR